MRQQQFEATGEQRWQTLGKLLVEQERLRFRRHGIGARGLVFHRLYRLVCRDLALAKERGYSPLLVGRLNDLVVRGHSQVYVQRRSVLRELLTFVLLGFPRALRGEIGYFWVALAAFAGAWGAIAAAIWLQPDLVYGVMPSEQVAALEAMYDPGNRVLGEARSAESNWYMFGFYIWNNVGIALRMFSTGILLGLGSLVVLLFNGMYLGAAATHLTLTGFSQTFWPFVIGHGAFELTAIVISGAAGLVLGHALLNPGRRSRVQALVERGLVAVRLLFGAALMMTMAAFVEAFWSANAVLPVAVKLVVGTLLWLLVVVWLWRGGAGLVGEGGADGS